MWTGILVDAQSENRLIQIAEDYMRLEKRKARWWSVLRWLLLIYVVVLMVTAFWNFEADELAQEHVAVIVVDGEIAADTPANADDIISQLEEAFAEPKAKAVVLRLNSGGGSPVQAGRVFDALVRLKQAYPQKESIGVVEEICASGCYYLAAGLDKIYANRASMVGSIGVRMDAFGVTELMEKWGIENRSLYAGEHKALLDPTRPRDEIAEKFLKTHILEATHQQFIEAVKTGRGERLKLDTPNLFSGFIWLGAEGVDLGLIDGLKDYSQLQQEDFKDVDFLSYAPEEKPLEALKRELGLDSALRWLRQDNQVRWQ